MSLNKYDFSLTENNKNSDYWKKIAKNNSKIFKNTLLLPPPNITGNLHLGHALDSITQDFLVRFSYLNKKPVYWVAGIDHAGISVQSKIENLKIPELDNNQKKREYTFETWYPQSRKKFFQQWEKLGLLIDYEKAVFSLDPIIQKQIRKAFIKLYHDGLIYRGKKLVNWDSKLKSVISDIEVENITGESRLYYLKYPLLRLEELEKKLTSFKVARVIIQNKEGDILLVKDKKWGWNLPGGKAEKGETLEKAAKRETLEETNIIIKTENLKEVKRKKIVFDDHDSEVFIYQLNKRYESKIKKTKEKNILEVKFFKESSEEAESCFRFFSIKKSKEETEKKVFVRAIIQNEEGQILLVKDKKWGWTLPGGKLERNETLEEAIKREVLEETGLTIKKKELAQLGGKRMFSFNNQNWMGYFYWTNKYLGEIKIREQEKEKMLKIGFFDKNSKEASEYSQYFSNKEEWSKILNNEYYHSQTKKHLLVATSRPETIFADEALFVNPNDKRYREYLGNNWKIKHPWTKKIIPILADKSIKIDFGTGVLKCTPGHDKRDYELSKKYQLPIISCCNEKGILNKLAGHYQGKEINNIRKELVKELVAKNICKKI